MVQTESVSSYFFGTKSRSIEQTPPRPPTPPRESPRSASKTRRLVTKDSPVDSATEFTHETPSREISPPSSSSDSIAADKPKKRVGWSPWTKYHKPDSPLALTPIRSSIDPKSLKSILKPYNSPIPLCDDSSPFDRPLGAHTYATFSSMLESIIQALGSTERAKKLDAYITFSNTLKAYDDIPDLGLLEAKLSSLCGFIKRDLDAKLEESGNADSQLIQQAIKLLTIFAWTPQLAEAMDDGTGSWFLQTAIRRIEDIRTPKLIVNHLLHFLAQQRFPIRILTSEKSNQIISVLETLDQRVAGKSITKERIDIYYKLLFQAKQTMLMRVNDWMDNLFGGLLSGVKEVRNRALACVAEIPRTLGNEKSIARCLSNIFSRDVGNGKRMFELIKERLELFIKEGEGVFVARMWGVVLLLIRVTAEQWEFFTHWLRIIEGCFNVSDKDVKVEAQVAWQKLIYAMNIGPNTTRKLLELLCKPLGQYLDPKNALSNTKRPRMAAMVNISVLLYYGFRPNAPSKQLSEIWDVVIVGVVEKLALSSKDEVKGGCNILSAIFDCSVQKPWLEDRVLRPPTMSPAELPRLDPKWVRTNIAFVLRTVEVALRRAPWKSEGDESGPKVLWSRVIGTLADAGSKEIKISGELMEAVAHMFNFFHRVWNIGPAALDETMGLPSESFIKKFSFLVTEALAALGTFPFTEKQLAYDEESKFLPAPTPTHKYSSGNSSTTLHPPVLHMLLLFLHPVDGVPVDKEYYECLRIILEKCCNSQDSRRKKLGLLASCANLLAFKDASTLDLGIWQILADLVGDSLPTPLRERVLSSPSPVGAEFRDAVKILEWGCRYGPPAWEPLLGQLCNTVQGEQGETCVAATIIDPLAEVLKHQLVDKDSQTSLRWGKCLVDKANYSRSKPSGEGTLRAPFGPLGRKPTSTETFEKLFDLVDLLLRRSYAWSTEERFVPDSISFLVAFGDLVSRCPGVSLVFLLRRTQEGISMWITDSARNFKTKVSEENVMTIVNVWTKVVDALHRLPQHDGKTLADLATLIRSGLESRFKPIVHHSIISWNSTFGSQGSLTYPKRVRGALKRLRPIADLKLPTFPDEMEDDVRIHTLKLLAKPADSCQVIQTPPQFSESQEKLEDMVQEKEGWVSPTPSRSAGSPFRISSPLMGIRDAPNFRPRRSLGTRILETPPARPKHMDSQIEFAAIEANSIGTESHTADSQLTERQKEVRRRQVEMATLFGDLNTSKRDRQQKINLAKDQEPSRMSRNATRSPHRNRFSRSPTKDAGGSSVAETPMAVQGNANSDPALSLNLRGREASPTLRVAGYPVNQPPTGDFSIKSPVDTPLGSPRLPNQNVGLLVTKNAGTDESGFIGDSDEPSVEDAFVDAPEDRIHSEGDAEYEVAKSSVRISVEVSPAKDSRPCGNTTPDSPLAPTSSEVERQSQESEVQGVESDVSQSRHPSPGAQILTEERAASGLPAKRTHRQRVKPRRRSSPRKAAKSPVEPPGTITVAGESTLPTHSPPPKKEPSGKHHESSPKHARTPKKPPVTSAPRTRSSSKKEALTKTTPSMVTRKRKLDGVDHYGPTGNEKPAVENAGTPTPKRRNIASPLVRRTRSSAKQNDSGNNDPSPDVSFIEETQINFTSPIPDSQDHLDELLGPTPNRSGPKPRASFTVGAIKLGRKESQVKTMDPDPEMAEDFPNTPTNPGRTRRKFRFPPKNLQEDAEKAESQGATPEPAQRTRPRKSLASPTADKAGSQPGPTAGEIALASLKKELRGLESAGLTPAECRQAENILFEAFSQFRRRGIE